MSTTTRDQKPTDRRAQTLSTATALIGELAVRLADQVIEKCAEQGVVLMPLKGVLLLARWPVLRGTRDLVDIDLLVRSRDIPKVSLALQALGFDATVRSSAGTTFTSDAWPLSVDIHRKLFPHGLFGFGTDGVFARATRDGTLFAAPVARMSDDDVFAHLVGHFIKGRGTFRQDKSLDDIRWMLARSCFLSGDADRLGRHLRSLGLKRAAGYALGEGPLAAEPVARAVLRSLDLTRADRMAVAAARLATHANAGAPRWWTPHLLDQSFAAGSRSFLSHADEGTRRRVARMMWAGGAGG